MREKLSLIDGFLLKMEVKRFAWVGVIYFLFAAFVASSGWNKTGRMNKFIIELKFYQSNLTVAILGGLIIALVLFRFLGKKQSAEFAFSMPIDKKKMFFTKYTAGIILMVPATIIYNIIASNNLQIWIKQGVVDDYSMIRVFSIVLLFEILAYTIGVIVANVTSSLIMSILLGAGVTMLPDFMDVTINRIMNLWIFGRVEYSSIDGTIMKIIHRVNPLTKLSYIFSIGKVYSHSWETLINTGVCIIIYIFIAFLLFRRRKEENCGKVMNFKGTKYIVSVGVTVVTTVVFMVSIYAEYSKGYIGKDGPEAVISTLLVGILVYYLSSALIEKSLKKSFTKKNLQVIIVTSILIVGVPMFMWFDPMNIGKVSFDFEIGKVSKYRLNHDYANLNMEGITNNGELEDILNEIIRESYKNRKTYSRDSMKSALNIFTFDEEGKSMNNLNVNFNPHMISESQWEKLYTSNAFRYKDIRFIDSSEYIEYMDINEGVYNFGVYNRLRDREKIEAIYEAIKSDRNNMDYAGLTDDRGIGRITLYFDGGDGDRTSQSDVKITESYKETLNVLEELNLKDDLILSSDEIKNIEIEDSNKTVVIQKPMAIDKIMRIINRNLMRYIHGVRDGRHIDVSLHKKEDKTNYIMTFMYEEFKEFVQ